MEYNSITKVGMLHLDPQICSRPNLDVLRCNGPHLYPKVGIEQISILKVGMEQNSILSVGMDYPDRQSWNGIHQDVLVVIDYPNNQSWNGIDLDFNSCNGPHHDTQSGNGPQPR